MKRCRKNWGRAAGVRAVRTFAQAALAAVGSSAMLLSQVDWPMVASTAALAAVLSLLQALTGLPEECLGGGEEI